MLFGLTEVLFGIFALSILANRPLFTLCMKHFKMSQNRKLLCADKPAVVATDAFIPRRQPNSK